ncbi:MAG: hypothetical protein EKK53_16460 [Burkholderiales bacterium]|nr:MAG: hypothetical protein EKK53_16460 [Burkholderiales bacterium]
MSAPAHLACLTLLIATPLAGVAIAHADVGGTLSVQSDARERGMSYSANRPSAQVGLAWDGAGGWYAGGQLGHARFMQQQGGTLQLYAGRVTSLTTELNLEGGVIARLYENVARYDYQEAYVGLIGSGWTLRLYASPDFYGIGQRSLYAELDGRWPLGPGLAAVGHLGLIRGWGGNVSFYDPGRRASRADVRAGLSWQLGSSSELQLAWVAASAGGPYTWTDPTRRRTAVLNVTTAF